MPRNPRADGHANTTVPDGVRRAAADMCLAARQLQHWMDDPYYKPRMLTREARADLADIRDRITTILSGPASPQTAETAPAVGADTTGPSTPAQEAL